MKTALLSIALGFTLTACAATDSRSQPSPIRSPHASQDAALEQLRHEGILSGPTRVVAAVWHEDIHKWIITLRHPSAEHPPGIQSYGFVDSAAENDQGGTFPWLKISFHPAVRRTSLRA